MLTTCKVAIVTGGASGLGREVCFQLVERGYKVVIAYLRSAAAAEETVRIAHRRGGQVDAVCGDVGQDTDCVEIAARAIALWGRIDVLVNCAGVTRFVPHADLDGLSAEDFLDVYRTNVVGAYQMIRACSGAMKMAGFGAVVNVSSISAQTAKGSSVAYAASKSALETLTKSLARALGPAIRVNAVSPGFIATGWFSRQTGDGQLDAMIREQEQLTPLRRAGQPEDIARAILYLADEGAIHSTGTILVCDAGARLI